MSRYRTEYMLYVLDKPYWFRFDLAIIACLALSKSLYLHKCMLSVHHQLEAQQHSEQISIGTG